MRKLILIIIILSGLWGGYWVIGSTALETGAHNFLKTKHNASAPVSVAYSDLSVRGFPNRFDTRLTDLDLVDHQNNIRWQAPFLQIYALSYKPYHVIAALPHAQRLEFQGQNLQINSDEIKGSIVFDPKPIMQKALEIKRSSFVINALSLISDKGWETSIKQANIATRQTPANALHYDIAAAINDILLPASLDALVDPMGQHPNVVDVISLDLTVEYTHPWDVLASPNKRPKMRAATINSLSVSWGDIQLQTSGALTIDPNGYPVGQLELVVTNWENLYDMAHNAHAIDPKSAASIRTGLKLLAGLSNGENVIKAPLVFANAQISLGPLAIGPAPRLPYRQ